ncbi:Piso0_002761 [Millerozyma farinosa CBS 7064]|uniref:Piso0_002761 protein n=1 Tax=Pichia sorbitophila (strain ATCC MYA-4447 / BCRC 22081 / CBS 7064 / NBRC 10061 / NRRL Y-12695) TaxID=559304 RepID=G8YDF7_PICSO|nr:Piso0_002761 [Millerozyma farinosa CBS 7064]
MTRRLPSPPALKATIIQLNRDLDQEDGNYEILTNSYSKKNDNGSGEQNEGAEAKQQRRKRRRASVGMDAEDVEERRNVTKQLHSIIEKKRRLKINREFEALKFLIPACRATTSGVKKPRSRSSSTAGGSNSKIDGMYKLSILKASVEYILYLHHIINQQHELLCNNQVSDYSFNIDFAKIPLDVNAYRNINKDFSFKDPAEQATCASPDSSSNYISTEDLYKDKDGQSASEYQGDNSTSQPNSNSNSESRYSLGSVDSNSIGTCGSLSDVKETVEETPHFSANDSDEIFASNPDSLSHTDKSLPSGAEQYRTKSLDGITSPLFRRDRQLPSPEISPWMAPILSLLKNSPCEKMNNIISSGQKQFIISSGDKSADESKFSLPDAALNAEESGSQAASEPRMRFFKSKIPHRNTCVIRSSSRNNSDTTPLAEQDASETLLALRKSSIDSLLN